MPSIIKTCFLFQKASQKQINREKGQRYQIRINIVFLNNLFFKVCYK